MRVSKLAFACGLFALAAAAAVSALASAPARGHAAGADATSAAPVTLADALAVSRRLGPVSAGRTIHLSLGLRGQHGAELERVLAEGRSVNPAVFALRYGPVVFRVRAALAAARRAGFSTSWHTGERLAFLEGPAAAVRSLFHVSLERYVTPQGRRFYAPLGRPVVPAALRPVVSAVGGLDDFARVHVEAIRPGGVTPADVLSIYDVKPLRDRGLTGAGETIVLPEISSPAQASQLRSDLAAYAARYQLPAFDLTVRAEPQWHPVTLSESRRSGAIGEAALDLEVIHAIAPGAKLIVYEEALAVTDAVRAELAMVSEHRTAIISDSIGFCEGIASPAAARLVASPWLKAAAEGMSHFVAAGDDGAYDCSQGKPAAVDFPAATPYVTAVGGTTVFQTTRGGRYDEIAWGDPIAAWGGGGGVSRIFRRPSWQRGPGVDEAASTGGRQVPDVAGLADINSGWNIIVAGSSHEAGGTSAAAPLWAGIAALIDEDLRKKGLPRIGFANPAIYWIGQHQSQFRVKPFHDITRGNNFKYVAGRGWDFTTGWGTPDAAALAAAWERYQRTVGR